MNFLVSRDPALKCAAQNLLCRVSVEDGGFLAV